MGAASSTTDDPQYLYLPPSGVLCRPLVHLLEFLPAALWRPLSPSGPSTGVLTCRPLASSVALWSIYWSSYLPPSGVLCRPLVHLLEFLPPALWRPLSPSGPSTGVLTCR